MPETPQRNGFKRPSLAAKLFGDADVVYSRETTSRLTDFAGTFLVGFFAVYFTIAGYLLYREAALS